MQLVVTDFKRFFVKFKFPTHFAGKLPCKCHYQCSATLKPMYEMAMRALAVYRRQHSESENRRSEFSPSESFVLTPHAVGRWDYLLMIGFYLHRRCFISRDVRYLMLINMTCNVNNIPQLRLTPAISRPLVRHSVWSDYILHMDAYVLCV